MADGVPDGKGGNDGGPLSGFAEVYRRERLATSVGGRKPPAVQPAPPPADLAAQSAAQRAQEELRTGLALSGGGIRSAAFSLGVLQALDARNGFHRIDFLSTVSGGGYAGAALVAGQFREKGRFPFSTRGAEGRDLEPTDVADSDAIRRLRDRCRYLMPEGWFDLVVSLAIILRGLAVNVVAVAAVVFAAAALTLFFNPTETALAHSWLYDLPLPPGGAEARTTIGNALGPQLLLTKALALVLAVWLVIWALLRSLLASSEPRDFHSDPDSRFAKGTAVLLIYLGVVLVAEMQALALELCFDLLRKQGLAGQFLTWISQQATAVAAGAGVLTGILAFAWRTLLGVIQSAKKDPGWGAFFRRAASLALLYALALALPLLIYCSYLALTLVGLDQAGAPPAGHAPAAPEYPYAPSLLSALPGWINIPWALLLLFLAIAAVVAWSSRVGLVGVTLCSRSWWRSRAFLDRRVAETAAAIAAAAAAAVALGIAVKAGTFGTPALPLGMAWSYLAIALLLFLVTALFTENANSLHQLYRDRLNTAFSLDGGGGRPLKLSWLARSRTPGGERPRPYPIINTAVNLQGSGKNKRQRNADFFVFTPDYAGSDATGYVRMKRYEKAEPLIDLATLTAISGAAVSSAMGRAGVAVLAPTLALLNVRLGFWARNPKCAHPPARLRQAQRDDWKLLYLFFEAFGQLNENRSKVYLSDGGHIDNLGLYQLLKRRCEVIIVADGEADPAMDFASLVDVERFARIDLGVRLDLPWQAIRDAALTRRTNLRSKKLPHPVSPAHAHAAIGTIFYPPAIGPGNTKLPGKEGILLYVKSSVTGDERSYVLDYEKRYPSFPHETTGDQFFSEEQFEAYRSLGFHALDRALTYSDVGGKGYQLLRSLRTTLSITDD